MNEYNSRIFEYIDEQQPMKSSNSNALIIGGIVAVLLVIAIAIAFMQSGKTDQNSAAKQATTTSDQTPTSPDSLVNPPTDAQQPSAMPTPADGSAAPANNPTTTPPAPTSAPATQPTSKSTSYKDGSYTAEGDYFSPGGAEHINVTLMVKNDVVTSASAVGAATNQKSQMYQNLFISGFQGKVVGKSIDSIQLDKVSGSSLTPQGFNDALTKIKAQAKV